MNRTLLAAALSAAALLTACGGGGGDAGTPPFNTGGTGTIPGATAKAADLALTVSAAQLINTGNNNVTVKATAVDANRNTVAGIPVILSVDNGAVINTSGQVTDAQGVVTGVVGVGADRSNRVVTVTAVSGELTRTVTINVVGAKLSATLTPTVRTGTTNSVEFRLVDNTGAAMANQPIQVTVGGGTPATGTTDSNGKFVHTYTAPDVATNLAIQAVAAGDSTTQNVQVQSPAAVIVTPPAAVAPTTASVDPSPSVVSVNTKGSNTNQVELRALFLGPSNLPVENVRVRFDLVDRNGAVNPSGTDGVVSWLGDPYVFSDAKGMARGTFTPGQRSSPTEGVTIRACYAQNDFPVGTCPNMTFTTLTVTDEALSVTIGTNELIKSGLNDLTYIKEYVVSVTDAAGVAKPGVRITPQVDLLSYDKGDYVLASDEWVKRHRAMGLSRWLNPDQVWDWAGTFWRQGVSGSRPPACPNEDADRNGARTGPLWTPGTPAPVVLLRGEDLAWSGGLKPRKSSVAVSIVTPADGKTNASGLAVVQIEYPKTFATWIDFALTVTAGVGGTEGRDVWVDTLPASSVALKNKDVTPAFAVSPFGVSKRCDDNL